MSEYKIILVEADDNLRISYDDNLGEEKSQTIPGGLRLFL